MLIYRDLDINNNVLLFIINKYLGMWKSFIIFFDISGLPGGLKF